MAVAMDAVVDRIIGVESDGDPNAKNKRSSATGLAQFLSETWLDMIRVHRPDLTKGAPKPRF
jgi:soluble lytic murein transglycosylase-like protein